MVPMDSFSCLSVITPRETRDLPTSIPTYFNAYLAAVLFFVIEAIAIVTKHLKYDNTINLLSLFFFHFSDILVTQKGKLIGMLMYL